ncbi:MAG TPA: hypothetical protein PKW21_14530 [Rhabdaerophilum sp.]|nr:hypothetical protein [Rhabdaerophilum sp.]
MKQSAVIRSLIALAALPLLTAGSASAQAPQQTVAAAMPVYAHIVRFPVPAGFNPAFQKDNEGRFFIFEMIPKGEHIMSWSQMLTVTGINGAANALPTPAQYLQNFTQGYRKACPDSFVSRSLSESAPKASEPALFFIGCGKVSLPNESPRSEAVIVGFFASPKGIYSVQWAERSPAQDRAPVFDEGKWRPRLDALKTARLCDRVPGEAAPYPSCK